MKKIKNLTMKRIIKKAMREISKYLSYKTRAYRKIKFNSSTKVQSSEYTIKTCSDILDKKQKGAYIRFGDGDIVLMTKKGDGRKQKRNKKLAVELRESIQLSGPQVIRGLPINSNKFGFEKGMKKREHKRSDIQAELFLREVFQYFVGNIIYSSVALHYLLVYKPQEAIVFLKKIKSFNPIFVGNEENSDSVIKKMFGETTFIKTPSHNAYQKINNIEENIIKSLKKRNRNYDVIIFSCGSSAKCLIKRIFKKYNRNVFLFDLGSVIDLFHGRNEWAWVRASGKDKKYWRKILEKISF